MGTKYQLGLCKWQGCRNLRIPNPPRLHLYREEWVLAFYCPQHGRRGRAQYRRKVRSDVLREVQGEVNGKCTN